MIADSNQIIKGIAERTGLNTRHIEAVVELLDQGATVPFIARFRKERTGSLDEVAIRNIESARKSVTELAKPGRDPRTENDDNPFTASVESFDELRVGMVVSGIVNNITAFGAFVNIGIKENALIHISRLSRKRVSAVSDILKLGQKIEAKVIDIDTSRRRIALSMIE